MAKRPDQPHGKRGWLRNSNPPGDWDKAPRCGARNRIGKPCRCPSMKNGRCYHHGGTSTGPKTECGKARSRRANWKHGEFSAETKSMIREMGDLVKKFAG